MAIGVSIVDQFAGASISHLSGRVGQYSLSAPFDVVASGFRDKKRLATPGVSVVIDAFFYGVIEDAAFGYRRRWEKVSSAQ